VSGTLKPACFEQNLLKSSIQKVLLEILTVTTSDITIFWCMTQYNIDRYRRFGEICCAAAFLFYHERCDCWNKFQMLTGEKI
jgi:hypothetical protein